MRHHRAPGTFRTTFSIQRRPALAAWACSIALLALTLQGFALAETSDEPAQNDKPAATVPLTISIVDEATERPVAGAEITLQTYGPEDKGKHETDAQGRFVAAIPDPQPNYVRITVKADGYVPVQRAWSNYEDRGDVEPIPQSFDFRLQQGTTIGGVVKDEDGKPIEFARISIRIPSVRDKILYSFGDWFTTTDKKGRWRCDVAPKTIKEIVIEPQHREYVADSKWFRGGESSMKSLRRRKAVLTMEKARTVAGYVRDEAGNPVEGASVRTGTHSLGRKPTMTDAKGFFEIGGCENRAIHIGVQMQGYAPLLRRVLPEDTAEPLQLTLTPGFPIRFRIVDTDGNPIEGVRVSPENYAGYRSSIHITCTTDAEGRASWDSAPADAVEYDFQKKGFARLGGVELVAGDEEHVVTLPKPTKVTGTVVDKQSGEPTPEFSVVPVVDWLRGGTPSVQRGQAFEGHDGKFEWETDRSDTGHYVRIEADGYVPAMSPMFKVSDGETQTLSFKLEKGENIRGIIRGLDGQPLEGADVFLRTPTEDLHLGNGESYYPQGERSAKTDVDGAFSFPAEPPPWIVAVVHKDGFAQATDQELRSSGELRLQPYARIEGKLVRGKKPVSDYRIRMYPIRTYNTGELVVASQYSTNTDQNGAFVLERVLPGRFSLSPNLGPWEPARITSAAHVPLEIEPGETVKVTLGGEGRTVVGKVVLPEGFDRKMHWDWGINTLVALRDGISVPEEVKDLGFDWRKGWVPAWGGTREGRTYAQTLQQYFVRLNPDGAFHISGVPDGEYALLLKIYDPPPGMG